ncbi:MAG TPA: hypothetical protein VJT73_07125 [Polyangiaceae bacterium]|nr:hypothetical protein [Polyangiaceae bacterium]
MQQAVGAPSASASAPEAPRPSRSKGLFVGAIVALLGVGAAYGIAARKGLSPLNGARSALSLLRGEAPSSPAPQLAAKEASPPNVEHAVAALPPAAAPPKGVDPASLPHPNTITPNEPTDILAESKAHAKSIPASKPAEKAPSPVERAAPVAAASAPKAEPAAPEPTGLAGAIKKAVGPTDQAAIPTETQAPSAAIRGDIPEVPAQGAIQGAIGSQRGAARSCVAGHDSPSRATLVFGSSGKVQSVSVTGPAAGSAAESCIRSALTKASVGAFRRPTFSVSTTISPP